MKSNLRQAPYNITDGDLIAFGIFEAETSASAVGMSRQQSVVSAQDFMSAEDVEYAKRASERQASWERDHVEASTSDGKKSKHSKQRPEVGISIKVDNFEEEELEVDEEEDNTE